MCCEQTFPSLARRRAQGHPGLMLGLHGNSQPSGRLASRLRNEQESDRDAGWRRQQPHRTYHGPEGNKASTFTPSHTYTAQRTRDSREQNKEKTRGPGEHPLFLGPIGRPGARAGTWGLWGLQLVPPIPGRARGGACARPGAGSARGPLRHPRTWL